MALDRPSWSVEGLFLGDFGGKSLPCHRNRSISYPSYDLLLASALAKLWVSTLESQQGIPQPRPSQVRNKWLEDAFTAFSPYRFAKGADRNRSIRWSNAFDMRTNIEDMTGVRHTNHLRKGVPN